MKRSPQERALNLSKIRGRRLANLHLLFIMLRWVLAERDIRLGQIITTFELGKFYDEPVDQLTRVRDQIKRWNEGI